MGIRVVIIEDHSIFLEGLRAVLGLDDTVKVVGEASGGFEGIQVCQKVQHDVVLVDINLPDISGIETVRRLRRLRPDLRILVLTVMEDPQYVSESIRAGANGYILKHVTRRQLIESITRVANGQDEFDPRLVAWAFRKHLKNEEEPSTIRGLSTREIEVVKLLAIGLLNKEIALRLQIEEATVKTHVTRILGKLGVSNRTEAALLAVKEGIAR